MFVTRGKVEKEENSRVGRVVGTEIQSYVDYSMPVRGMDYDAVEYKRQISIIKNRRKSKKATKLSMSPLAKEDRLIPAITLVLYM